MSAWRTVRCSGGSPTSSAWSEHAMALADAPLRVPLDWLEERQMNPPDQERPLLVAYDLRDVLDRIQRGVDAANSALALKAEKTDMLALRQEMNERFEKTDARVTKIETSSARNSGWRAGFLVAFGAGGSLLTGLIIQALQS